jgi:hypothetical protein
MVGEFLVGELEIQCHLLTTGITSPSVSQSPSARQATLGDQRFRTPEAGLVASMRRASLTSKAGNLR